MNEVYIEMLLENGEKHDDIAGDYKKKPKELILDLISEVIFIKHKQKNKPGQIITETVQSEAVSSFNDNKLLGEDFEIM